jgi:hypothetical protein
MGDFSYFSCCWFQVAKLFLQSFKFSLQPSSLQEQVHDCMNKSMILMMMMKKTSSTIS